MFSIWGLVRGVVWDDDDGETPPFIREMSPQHSSSHNCYLQLLQQPPALPCQPWSHLHRSQQRFAPAPRFMRGNYTAISQSSLKKNVRKKFVEKPNCYWVTLQASTIWSPQIPVPSKYKECWNIQISRIETIPVRLTTALDCSKLFSVGYSVQWGIYCRETGNIVLATRIW